MKCVQIVTQMEGGGAQRVAVLLSEKLIDEGHEVELWFLYKKRPMYNSLPYVKVLLDCQPKSLRNYLSIIFAIIMSILKHQPDAIITHTHYSNVLVQPIALLLSIRRRIAVQHNPLETYPRTARVLDKIFGTIGVYSANIAVSNTVISSMKSYSRRYLNKVERIYNGIPEYSPVSTQRNCFLDKFSIPQGAPILVNVGRLAVQKNQNLLIKCLGDIPEAHLVIVGDGELKEFLIGFALDSGCADRVHFLGEIEPHQVSQVLSIASVFVFPSLYESMGLALVEAMSYGLPIVASDIPAVREVLGDKEPTGLVVSPDERDFVRAINELLGNKELASQLGQKARERAKLFNIRQMVNAYNNLLLC